MKPIKSFLFNFYLFITKINVFLFKKPKIKIGDRLNYYDKICHGVFFSWKHGGWFLLIHGNLSISYKLEMIYKEKKNINN